MPTLIGNDDAYAQFSQVQNTRNAERIGVNAHATVETHKGQAAADVRICQSHAVDRGARAPDLFVGLVLHVYVSPRARIITGGPPHVPPALS